MRVVRDSGYGGMTPKEERAQGAKELAQKERLAQELAEQQVQQLLERLREAGIDPDQN